MCLHSFWFCIELAASNILQSRNFIYLCKPMCARVHMNVQARRRWNNCLNADNKQGGWSKEVRAGALVHNHTYIRSHTATIIHNPDAIVRPTHRSCTIYQLPHRNRSSHTVCLKHHFQNMILHLITHTNTHVQTH